MCDGVNRSNAAVLAAVDKALCGALDAELQHIRLFGGLAGPRLGRDL